MAFEFKFPDVGEGITEGELVAWKVREGDSVKEDQVLAEVETDKAVVEIPSPRSGKILKLHYREGQTVNVGSVMVTIGEAAESLGSLRQTEGSREERVKQDMSGGAKVSNKDAMVETGIEPEHYKSTGVVGSLEDADDEVSEIQALPSIRKLAMDLGVDISKVRGSGSEGRITENDIRNFNKNNQSNNTNNKTPIVENRKEEETPNEPTFSKPKIVKKYDMYGYVDRINYRGIRKTIGENMVKSQTKTASVTHHDEADITDLFEHRNKEKLFAQEKGVKLTLLPFITKALINALKKNPIMNSTLDEDNQEIIVKKYYNIGIAVDTEVGLMVPVVKIADKKSVLDLAKEINELADKAKQRKLDIADMKGGTFTITNYGSVGGYYATPIINYPECAILGVGRMVDRPRLINGEMQVRKILPISITFDHRITDGAQCARFANDLIVLLEDPDQMMLEG